MIRKWSQWPLWALAVLVLLVAGVPSPVLGDDHDGSAGILVFAAASLAGALEPEVERFQAQSGIDVQVAYASSGLLARQIVFGAPADLIISAHPRWLDYLAQRKLLARQPPVALFSNKLVLATARRDMAPLVLKPGLDIAPLLDGGLLAMGDPDHVPVGIYARAALQWLGSWQALAGRITRASDARAALATVERGEVALGLVYLSDARLVGLNIVGTFPPA
ncbi:MAG: molybdate ABC transporter substrate-binding protein, partial [Hyphomicrobiales bacterium]